MRYKNAQKVLPDEIVKIIQEYINGEYLYIPSKSDIKKAWGENNGTREKLKSRNKEIYEKYIKGHGILDLAEEYYLSDKSIRRIIGEEKKYSKIVQNHK